MRDFEGKSLGVLGSGQPYRSAVPLHDGSRNHVVANGLRACARAKKKKNENKLRQHGDSESFQVLATHLMYTAAALFALKCGSRDPVVALGLHACAPKTKREQEEGVQRQRGKQKRAQASRMRWNYLL